MLTQYWIGGDVVVSRDKTEVLTVLQAWNHLFQEVGGAGAGIGGLAAIERNEGLLSLDMVLVADLTSFCGTFISETGYSTP